MGQPKPQPPTLDKPATTSTLHNLFLNGLLTRDQVEDALAQLNIQRKWLQHSRTLLLILGSLLILAGITFFVAYNWMEMGKLIKLGGLQTLIIACAGAALYRGIDGMAGQALLFAACFLVGVYLAAFGQVYQTGADAWELFRAWALLISFWVIVSRSPAHWFLLLVVFDAAIIFYCDQVLFYRWEEETWAWLLVAVIQFAAVLGLESGNAYGYFRPKRTWPRWVLVPAVLALLCAPITKILIRDQYDQAVSWLIALLYLGTMLGGYPYLRHQVRDLFGLTCLGFSAAWIVMAIALRLLNLFDSDSCGGMVLVGLLLVGMITGLVQWIRRLNTEIQAEQATVEQATVEQVTVEDLND